MMRLLTTSMMTLTESVALLLVAKSTVVLAGAMVAGWLTRRRPAAVRHLIFAAAFAVLALLPLAATMLPAVSVRLTTSAAAHTGPAAPIRPIVDSVIIGTG